MNCPKCGKKTTVSNTAGMNSSRIYLLDKIAPFIEWYTNEFVARDRRCNDCKVALLTIELDIEDLIGALRYAQIDGPCLTQSIIDWSAHIRTNAQTFRDDFQPTRPQIKSDVAEDTTSLGGENMRGTLAGKGKG